MTYAWFRDGDAIDAPEGMDSLLLDTVSLEDTAHGWSCRVSSRWGDMTSPSIRLRIMFRVFYDGNDNTGGEVPDDTHHYAPGDKPDVLGNTGNLVRRGYEFGGWKEKDGSNDKIYQVDDIVRIADASITVEAVWNPNDSFTLTYDGNGAEDGEAPEPERHYKAGELVTVGGNSGNFTRDGFTFIGWNTRSDDSGTGYDENDTFTMGEEEITLYARWTDNPTFTVIYNGNGADSGEAPEDAASYEENDTITVAANSGNLVKEGNAFVGWSTEPDGEEGTFYTPGETFIMGTDDIELYARWTTEPIHKLSYLGNGNTGGSVPEAVSQVEGKTVRIAGAGSLTRKGYDFIGWNTGEDGKGDTLSAGESFTMGSDSITLYALWEIARYTITYDGNCLGVEKVPDQTTRKYDTEFSLSENIPTCVGYTFTTWKDERGTDYDPGDPFSVPDADVTLHADWKVNRYTITYNGNDSTTGGTIPQPDTVNYHDSVNIAMKGDLARTGHTFTGWNTKKDGSETAYPADTTILMGAEDLTLYAHRNCLNLLSVNHL